MLLCRFISHPESTFIAANRWPSVGHKAICIAIRPDAAIVHEAANESAEPPRRDAVDLHRRQPGKYYFRFARGGAGDGGALIGIRGGHGAATNATQFAVAGLEGTSSRPAAT
jgi:hypothetical protein